MTSKGTMSEAAQMRITTKYLNGLVPETSMASNYSVNRMEPSSAQRPEALRPAQIRAVITGPMSRTMEIPTMLGIQETAPISMSVGRVCKANTNPLINPVTTTKSKEL